MFVMALGLVTATPSTWLPATRSGSGASSGGWGKNKIVDVSFGYSVSLLFVFLVAVFFGSKARRRGSSRTRIGLGENSEVDTEVAVEDIIRKRILDLDDEDWPFRLYPQVEHITNRRTRNLDDEYWSTLVDSDWDWDWDWDSDSDSDSGSKFISVITIHDGSSRDRLSAGLNRRPPSPIRFGGYRIGDITINPWLAEHNPNPVIFPHLRSEEDSCLVDTRTRDASKSPSLDVERGLPETVSDSLAVPIPQEFISGLSSRGSSATLLPTSDLELSLTYPICEQSRQPSSHSEIPEPSSSDFTFCSTAATSFYLPLMNSDSHDGTPHTCVQCIQHFRTVGQLNTHTNRRHRRRYTCDHCTSAFALKADLQRHVLTVHRDTYQQEARVWRCSNTGCSVPNKEFRRKDNFVRHVSRCSREIEAR